jgi:DNA gyrase subunit A
MGIGIGAASSIPQFNIREVNNALEKLLLNPDIGFDDIYCAPDFATGALLLNEEEVKKALCNGQGSSCKLRSVVEWDAKEKCFIVTQIPYAVYTNTICEELSAILADELNNPGIDRYNDLTGSEPLIKIYLTKRANPDRVLKYLFKNTSLQSHYGINMTMLEDGRFPRVFGWKEALEHHIAHEKIVYRRGFEYDLAKIEKRIHIIDGLLICIASIDEVVKTIKSAPSTAVASKELQAKFLLDEEQAKAVLDMKLSRLANLEVKKLEDEREKLKKEADNIHAILENEDLFNNELIRGWREVAQKFGDARRTQVLNVEKDEDEVVEKKQLSLSFTNKGAVFVTETSSLYSQRRNGVGTKFKLEPEEFVVDNLVGENTDTILFFTKKGMYYHMNLGAFNIGEKQYLSNFNISGDITAAALVNKKDSDKNIVFITKNGLIKKSKLSEYNLKRSTGAQALKLDDDDEIVSILFINNERIGILSRDGQFIMIESAPIRTLGRLARGIIGIKLNPSDYVVSARAIGKDSHYLFSITSDGYGKNTALSEFNITNTNTKGVKIQKSDNLCDFIPIAAQGDILVNSNTTQIRIKSTDIPTLSRGALGVKLMKLTDNYVIGVASI